MDTVRVNVCVPYLLMVTRFFINATKTPEDTHNFVPPPKETNDVPPEGTTKPESSRSPGALNEPLSPVVEETTLTISGRFKKPEIILFADSTQKHSKVLVMKVSLTFYYRLMLAL